MQLVSSSTKTILSNIHRLSDKKVFEHNRGGSRYMQVFNHHQLFVETDHQDILEIRRVDLQRNDIHFVKQLNVDEVSCVAASKLLHDRLALSTPGGQIKVINSRTGQLVETLQHPPMPRNILFLDYNAFDERIAAVNSDGHVIVWNTIFDRQVQVFDNASDNSVARFHPRLRLHLACGTNQGTVRVYDTLTWQKVFQVPRAHADGVTEIALSKGDRNIFLSSGYDAHVNLYDLRAMTKVREIDCFCPLGTMCISDCARYFAVGSEMGGVATFDMRMTRPCISASDDLHSDPVRGMFFVPSSIYEQPIQAGPMEYPLPDEAHNLLSSIFDEYKEAATNCSGSGSPMNRCDQETTSNASFTPSENTDSTVRAVVWPCTLADCLNHRTVHATPENTGNCTNQIQPMVTRQTPSTADPSSIQPQSPPTTSFALAQGQETSPLQQTIEEIMLILQETHTDISTHIPQLEYLQDHVRGPDAVEVDRFFCEHSRLLNGLSMKAIAVAERIGSIESHTEQLIAENIRMKRELQIAHVPATEQ